MFRHEYFTKFFSFLFFMTLFPVITTGINGELSTALNVIKLNSGMTIGRMRLQYNPWLKSHTFFIAKGKFDWKLSWNFVGYRQFSNSLNGTDSTISQPYRIWIRFSTDRFESRLGLQKITFGSARLFRSLMWFDRLDPRDPLQLTEGVYGLRLRYDFQNNTSIWLWNLYGNRKTKGWERIPTRKKTFEHGGRFQSSIGKGEVAFTFHHRWISKVDSLNSGNILLSDKGVVEFRWGLDGMWDIGPGVWFETVFIHASHGANYPDWQSYLTVGADYTFGIGNGLTIVGEHFLFTQGDLPLVFDQKQTLSGIVLSYAVGILDQLLFLGFYDWKREHIYQYISWQRTYDRWALHLSGYNSVGGHAMNVPQSLGSLGIRGFQLMVIFNH